MTRLKTFVTILLLLILSACTTGPTPIAQTPTAALPSGVHPAEATLDAPSIAAGGPTIAPSATAKPRAARTANIDPLTGQKPASPELLERRPVIVKIQNLPRPREQWGVSSADLVYEYYTEEGSTRFSAVFYGQNPEMVAPIRSARWFDMHLIRMYGANFVFGSAYSDLLHALFNSEFGDRLLIEQPSSCPAICRYDPNGKNFLTANLPALQDYMQSLGMDDTEPDLSGMTFDKHAPQGGQPAENLFQRFSAAVYDRWEYVPNSGRYQRFADKDNDLSGKDETYLPLIDQATGKQIAADNVVVIMAEYVLLSDPDTTEVFDIDLTGSGMAYAARDGRLYNLHWQRIGENSVLQLTFEDGTPFPLKPGQTWFEVMGIRSSIDQNGSVWRFQHLMP